MNTILFDPGGDMSDYSLQCSCVSELKARVFGRRNDGCATIKVSIPKYSPKVLEGNWFEERVACEPIQNYTPPPIQQREIPIPPAKKDLKENFKIARMIRDKGRGMTRDLLADHHSAHFQNNFSTVYDLTYRIIPQGLDGPQLRTYNSRINKWVPEHDLTNNFGNVTGYGMKEYVKASQEELILEANEIPRSNYQCDYTEKEMPADIKRFHRKRMNLDTPDLRHLDIDLNTCWSRYLGQGYQKKNICQRISCGRY